MDTFSHVPPGFRFHPTDEELVDYYLRKKVNNRRIDLDVIKDVDLYKIEPWDLQEICKIGSEDQQDWYFFSHKDKKYPTGTRTNRATAAGFWKATGRDKAIYSKHELIGMRKTLVFYKGRAPNGQKSDWIMHEYRLETDENGTPQEEGWVVCRAFKKKIATVRSRMSEHESPIWYDDQVSFMPDSFMESPDQVSSHLNSSSYNNYPYPCKKENEMHYQIPSDHFLQLPLLESPTPPPPMTSNSPLTYGFNTNHANATRPSVITQDSMHQNQEQGHMFSVQGNNDLSNQNMMDDQQVTDWRVLDKFVASQLSHEENEYTSNHDKDFHESDDSQIMMKHLEKQEILAHDNAANTSSSTSCPIDLWK